MDWKKYEKEILRYFEETYPDTQIYFDKKILGRFSKTPRQIDILIEGELAGYPIRIAVDCKYFSRNIDVKVVESFCAMVEDIKAHQGVLITAKGYSQAAINRAHYGSQKVELDIINFEELKDLQSFEAISYVENFGLSIPAPFGWVFNLDNKINSFATIHQRGLTFEEAQNNNEWMYMQFWKRDEPYFNIESLIEFQNASIIQIDENAHFENKNPVKRNDGKVTKIRVADVPSYPAIEVTGFVEFNNYIFFVVLFTPKELKSKNVRKLKHILKVVHPIEIQFNNNKVIEQSLKAIGQITDNEEKANRYFQIGRWYKQMGELKKTIENYVIGINYYPTHYSNLKEIIEELLFQELNEEAKKYSIQLFEIEPENPTVPNDLIDIFFRNNKPGLLIDIFNYLIENKKEIEVLGNLTFHLSVTYLNLENEEKAKYYMQKAKELDVNNLYSELIDQVIKTHFE